MQFEETPCYQFFLGPLEDPMLIILIVAAIISIPVGVYENHGSAKGALEGIAILIAVCIVVIVSAYNDWAKEQEFKKLQEVYANSAKFFVYRNGVNVELEFEELVVGDIIKLE
jgi:magnesium-transporting ATPase (P-type)